METQKRYVRPPDSPTGLGRRVRWQRVFLLVVALLLILAGIVEGNVVLLALGLLLGALFAITTPAGSR